MLLAKRVFIRDVTVGEGGVGGEIVGSAVKHEPRTSVWRLSGKVCVESGILSRCAIDTRGSTPPRTSVPTFPCGQACEIEARGCNAAGVKEGAKRLGCDFSTGGGTELPAA